MADHFKKMRREDVDKEDPLYKFTSAIIIAGGRSTVNNIPLKNRGLDGNGRHRTSNAARLLHERYFNILQKDKIKANDLQFSPT